VNKKWLAIAFVSLVLGAGAGCKQGLGERCEVNEDCSSGVCASASPKVCVGENNNQAPIDAMLPLDTGDAAPDAPDAAM
jgi:hypothetical protein